MKIPKEQLLVIIIGLFLVSYLLGRIIPPLQLKLSTPYAFLNPSVFSKYPFTAVVVILRGISLFVTPLFLLSFISERYFAKVGMLLVVGSLSQLYSLQQLISGTTLIPFEWAISLSIAGVFLILSSFGFALKGIFLLAKTKISLPKITFEDVDSDD